MNACDKKTLTKILGKLITKLTNKTGGTTKKNTKKLLQNLKKNTTNPKKTTTDPASTTTDRNTGTVISFNKDKGFGSIKSDKDEELFAHYSEIKGDGLKTLKDGERVTFDVKQGPNGKKEATNIQVAS